MHTLPQPTIGVQPKGYPSFRLPRSPLSDSTTTPNFLDFHLTHVHCACCYRHSLVATWRSDSIKCASIGFQIDGFANQAFSCVIHHWLVTLVSRSSHLRTEPLREDRGTRATRETDKDASSGPYTPFFEQQGPLEVLKLALSP